MSLVPVSTGVGTFDHVPHAWDLAEKISRTGMVPDTLKNKPDEIAAVMLTGLELGLGPMHSLKGICVVKGRPTLFAETMRTLALSAGHEIWLDDDNNTTRVTVYGRRKGSQNVSKITWTMDAAKKAGIVSGNWLKYPQQMLEARATSQLCRLIFADCTGGLPAAEEVADYDDDEPVVGDQSASAPATRKRRATNATGRAARTGDRPPPEPGTEPPPPPLPGEDDEILDAEIVEPDVPTHPIGERMPSIDQTKMLFGLVNKLGLGGNDEESRRANRLAWCAEKLGLDELESSSVLTSAQVSALIDFAVNELDETPEPSEPAA